MLRLTRRAPSWPISRSSVGSPLPVAVTSAITLVVAGIGAFAVGFPEEWNNQANWWQNCLIGIALVTSAYIAAGRSDRTALGLPFPTAAALVACAALLYPSLIPIVMGLGAALASLLLRRSDPGSRLTIPAAVLWAAAGCGIYYLFTGDWAWSPRESTGQAGAFAIAIAVTLVCTADRIVAALLIDSRSKTPLVTMVTSVLAVAAVSFVTACAAAEFALILAPYSFDVVVVVAGSVAVVTMASWLDRVLKRRRGRVVSEAVVELSQVRSVNELGGAAAHIIADLYRPAAVVVELVEPSHGYWAAPSSAAVASALRGSGLSVGRRRWITPIKDDAGNQVGTLTLTGLSPDGDTSAEVQLLAAAISKAFASALTYQGTVDQAREQTRLARTDSLTGLLNRMGLTQDSELLLAGQDHVAVVFVDLDRFKLVNDVFGHNAGDELLVAVADDLREAAPPGSVLARVGGDEFVALVTVAGPRTAGEVAQRIVTALGAGMSTPISVAASAGAAVYPEQGRSLDVLLKLASAAMTDAKHAGRGQASLVDDDLIESQRKKEVLVPLLRTALISKRIVAAAQPQFSMVDGSVIGAELLVRWQREDGAIVGPGSFMAVVEQEGFSSQITDVIVDHAAEVLSRVDRSLLPHLSVNIPGVQIGDMKILGKLATMISSGGLDPSRLIIELTETSMLPSVGVVVDWLGRLNALGIHAAIDDAARGFGPLISFGWPAVSEVKLDSDLTTSATVGGGPEKVVLESLVNVSRAYGHRVVAEGVETVAQLEMIAAAGVDCVQGFLFARPMMIPDLYPWLDAGHPISAQALADTVAVGLSWTQARAYAGAPIRT